MPGRAALEGYTPNEMASLTGILQLCELTLRESSTGTVLHSIGTEAVHQTGGKWAMVALVDQDAGSMFIRCTVGEGWTDAKRAMELAVSDASGDGITSYVAATGLPYISGDVTRDSHYRPMFSQTLSEIAVPIHDSHGRLRGVLNVESDRPNTFSDEHLSILRTLAALIAIQLQMDTYSKRHQALVKIGTSLPISADEESLLDQVISVSQQLLRFEACSIFLLDEPTGQFVLRETRGTLAELVNVASYQPGEGLTGWVAMHCKPIRVMHPRTDKRWAGRYLEIESNQIGAFLAVPILTRDRCVGVIRVIRRESANPWLRNEFTFDDEEVLTAIAGQLGAGLEGIRMLGRLLKSERMAAWGELSAKAAHMLGNSAFAIEGDINELRHLSESPDSQPAEYRYLADSLRKGITRLEEILAEFRDFVMATQLNKQELDINQLLAETMDTAFPKRARLSLDLKLAENLPRVQGDEIKLGRAFSELIENAFHFQTEGVITLRTELVAPDAVPENLALARGRPYVKVEVQDQGPGVPVERKKQIFNPFNSSRVKGMGLGLSIVKGIIEAHGGVVFEDGVPGEGARFVSYLPVRSVKNGRD